jgi:hypothetical protein
MTHIYNEDVRLPPYEATPGMTSIFFVGAGYVPRN